MAEMEWKRLPDEFSFRAGSLGNEEIGTSGDFAAPEEAPAAEAELLRRARQYDSSAVAEIYDRFHRSIYRYAYEISGSRSIAEDITQEVFLMMVERHGPISRLFARFDAERGGLEGYLLGVARRLARKSRMAESRWLPIDENHQAQGNSTPDSAVRLGQTRQAIRSLPFKYREAVVLCCLEERSYEEAGWIAGCSAGTIASRLFRCRRMLAERLDQTDQTSDRG